MAVTQSQSIQPGSIATIAVGNYKDTGTAAAFTITTGFQPRYVKVENVDDRNFLEWYDGQAAAEAQKQLAAGTRTNITTLGITVSASGFTVGLDTDVNVTSKQLRWIAIG